MDMNHEEELQKKVENREPVPASADAEAYRHVFAAVEKEMNFALPAGFADKVVQKIMAEAQRKEAARDRLWFILAGILFLGGFVASLVFVEFNPTVDFKPSVGVFTFLSGYPGLILFGVVFIALLHFVDKKFIRSTR
jgi:hypothetical protein